MDTLTFDFKTNVRKQSLICVLCAVLAACFIYWAMTNEGGFETSRLTLSTQGATNLYWFTAMFLSFLVLVGIWTAIHDHFTRRYIVLGPSSIRAPKSGVSLKIIEIPYVDVTRLAWKSFRFHKYISVRSKTAKLDIAQLMVPDKAQFAALYAELERRCA